MTDAEIVKRLITEYLECRKDYDRHEIPVGWNNYGIADNIASIIGCILVGCDHSKCFRGSICDDCSPKLDTFLKSRNQCNTHKIQLNENGSCRDCNLLSS